MASVDDAAWRTRLPSLVDRCAKLWSLAVGDSLEGAYLAGVYGCTGPNGEDLVLKLSSPVADPALESRALAHWDGHGAARLVAWDQHTRALLIERIRPGTLLMDRDRSHPDDELAVWAAAGALPALQKAPTPPAGAFPSFEKRLRWWLDYTATHGEADAGGTRMLPEFERCALALHASATRKTLAHGDFVAKNLLLGPDGRYVAIDPLPYIGDPAADAGQFSAYHSPVATVIPRAHAIAEATGNDPDRAAQWAAVWMIFQARETWRDDSDDVQAWVLGEECGELLGSC